MLDILLVTMSLICVFTMFFLAYMMKHHLDVITKLESELAKFKEICSVLNTKKDKLEDEIERLQELCFDKNKQILKHRNRIGALKREQ